MDGDSDDDGDDDDDDTDSHLSKLLVASLTMTLGVNTSSFPILPSIALINPVYYIALQNPVHYIIIQFITLKSNALHYNQLHYNT